MKRCNLQPGGYVFVCAGMGKEGSTLMWGNGEKFRLGDRRELWTKDQTGNLGILGRCSSQLCYPARSTNYILRLQLFSFSGRSSSNLSNYHAKNYSKYSTSVHQEQTGHHTAEVLDIKSPPDWHSAWKFEKVPYSVHWGSGGQAGLTLRRFRRPVLFVNWTKRTKLPQWEQQCHPCGHAPWASQVSHTHKNPVLGVMLFFGCVEILNTF